jgi:hypothetical protein
MYIFIYYVILTHKKFLFMGNVNEWLPKYVKKETD